MEIEHALLQRNIDLAVHSLKDLPTTQPEGLCISVVGTREDVRDVLVMNSQIDRGSLIELDHSRYRTYWNMQFEEICANSSVFPGSGNLTIKREC